MKRSKALTPLSHDHLHGLAVAHRLTTARREDANEASREFLRFWRQEGNSHFRHEEEVLLPAFARYAPAGHEAVVRVLVEHVDLRRRAADLEHSSTADLEALRALGELLRKHIRHEERVLFPLIEQAVSPAELDRVGAALDRAGVAG